MERNKSCAALKIADWRPAIIGAALAMMMLLQVLAEGSFTVIQISSLVVLLVLTSTALTYTTTNAIPILVWVVFAVFSCLLICSIIIALQVIGSVSFLRVFAIIAYLFVGFLFASRLDHKILERTLPAYGITLALVLSFVLYDNDRIFERLSGHLHPNLWGFILATSIPLISFSSLRPMVKTAIVFFFFYLLAFELQTRAAFLWSVLALAIFVPFWLLQQRMRSQTKSLLFAAIVCAFLIVAFLVATNLAFFSNLLHLDSVTRGLGSGLSGRTTLWALAFEEFKERPLFGHGFDAGRYFASTYFESYVIGEIGSLHNSYFTMFFDLGLIGGSIYIFILLSALSGAVATRSFALIGFMVVYLGMGITESRPLNVANSSGLLFAVFLPYLSTIWYRR